MPRTETNSRSRARGGPRALLLLNGALLALLGAVTLAPSAEAQPRARATYTMASGRAEGAAAGIVYIVDATNQELIAVTMDPNEKTLAGVGYRNLEADIAARLRAAGGR